MALNPDAFGLREMGRPPPPSPWPWFAGIVTVLALVAGGLWIHQHRWAAGDVEETVPDTKEQPDLTVSTPPPNPSTAQVYWRSFVFPTDRTNLLDAPVAETIQDTGTGNPQSGLFGTVRTGDSGLGQFHEGIDIRAIKRDRRGNALDKVYAVSDGRVAYVSRIAGNSNYGKYVVLLHPDPVGDVYTLYAHLADVEAKILPGMEVTAGQTLGQMGHTSSSGIPAERAHLHFEIGLVVNARFGDWYRAKKMKPDHGAWHGWNLLGVEPLTAFRFAREHGRMDFGGVLKSTPVAFTVAIKAAQPPDFFRRHPALWSGPPFDGTAFVVNANENGTPLSGRNATTDEKTRLGKASVIVLAANADTLARNGRRLVLQSGGTWRIGSNGNEWLEVLLYPQRLR